MSAKLTYGKTVETKEVSVFYVEALWPCTCSKPKRGCCDKKFSRFSSRAFNDRRDPNTHFDGYGSAAGNFDAKNEDVSKNRLERDPYTGHLKENPVFEKPADALAYAKRLAEFGELASKYDNMTHIPHWRDRHSGKIKTRVVHERSAKICKIVTAVK